MNSPLVLPLIALCALAGCASTARRPSLPLPGTEACIFSTNVNGWDVLDDSNLVVHAPLPKDTYLIRLFAPVHGLAFQEKLGFEDGDHDSRLCSSGDSLVIGGSVPQRMPIVAVRKIEPEDIAALKAAIAAAKQK